METREYFEKTMQDFNQHRNGRSLRKYCADEGVDYKWLCEYRKTYAASSGSSSTTKQSEGFVRLKMIDEAVIPKEEEGRKWEVLQLVIGTPSGETIEIKSSNLGAVSELLRKMTV